MYPFNIKCRPVNPDDPNYKARFKEASCFILDLAKEEVIHSAAIATNRLRSRDDGGDDFHYVLSGVSQGFPDLYFEVTISDNLDGWRVLERYYYHNGAYAKAKIKQEITPFNECVLAPNKEARPFTKLQKDLEKAKERSKQKLDIEALAAQARAKLSPEELSALLTFET